MTGIAVVVYICTLRYPHFEFLVECSAVALALHPYVDNVGKVHAYKYI